MDRIAAKTAVPILNKSEFSKIPIMLPPLNEQRAIAAVLDAIDEAIERTEAVISATERLRDALLHELLTRGVPGWHTQWRSMPGLGIIPSDWQVTQLIDACDMMRDGDWIESKDQGGSDYRLLQLSNIGVGEFVETGTFRWISQKTFEELNCTEIHLEDVLIARMPDPVGRAIHVDELSSKAIVAVDIAIVRAKRSALTPKYLCYWLNSAGCLRRVDGLATGTTRKRIRRSDIEKLQVPLPPLDEQQAAAAVVESVGVAIVMIREERDSLHESRASLSDALLNGRVRAQGETYYG